MSDNIDVVRGAIKLDNFPETCCFTSFEEFMKALPEYLSIEIPKSITNVYVGYNQPSEADTDTVWFRTGAGSSFIGIFIYSLGQWRQVYPIEKSIIRVYGDSRTPPAGYSLANSFMPSAAANTWIVTTWHVGGTYPGPTGTIDWYDVFDVVYTGF